MLHFVKKNSNVMGLNGAFKMGISSLNGDNAQPNYRARIQDGPKLSTFRHLQIRILINSAPKVNKCTALYEMSTPSDNSDNFDKKLNYASNF